MFRRAATIFHVRILCFHFRPLNLKGGAKSHNGDAGVLFHLLVGKIAAGVATKMVIRTRSGRMTLSAALMSFT
ncbi:MAG: hypothetical protein ACI965_001834 [Paraglaciecola sp.]|jgi:hypothetical protein